MMALVASAFFVLTSCVCSLQIVAAVPTSSDPICVVGAGASGLGTVLALNKKGYNNILVFEKDAGPGGKAKNWVDPEGNQIYLGPVLGSSAYTIVQQLATQLGVPTTNVSLLGATQVFNYDTSTIIPFLSLPANVTALTEAFGAYAALWESYASYLIPGFANGVPTEISGSFLTWLVSNGLEALLPLFFNVVSPYGYGSLLKFPTVYALAYNPPQSLAGVLGTAQLFSIDFHLLLTKLASTLNAKFIYNAKITATQRKSSGVTIQYTTPGKSAVKKGAGCKSNKKGRCPAGPASVQRRATCSRLVVAFPQRLDLLQNFDLDDREVAVFAPVETNQYFSSVLKMPNLEPFSRANLLKLSGVASPPFVLSDPAGNGQPCLYTVRAAFALTSLYGTVYSWKDSNADGSNTPISLDEIKSLIVSSLSPLNRNASQPVSDAVPINPNDIKSVNAWDYFPHYNITSIQSGLLADLENLQGYRSTYYTSGLRSFEIVEAVLASASELVSTYF